MNTKAFSAKKLLSLFLVIAMMMTMVLPTNVFAAFSAATNATISSNIETVALAVGETAEFTVSIKANDDAGINVIGRYEIDSETAISKMEILEEGNWITMAKNNAGDFGGSNGFALKDSDYTFRVTFAQKGTYKFKVNVVTFNGVYGKELCSETDEIKVIEYANFEELTATIANAATYSADEYTATSYKVLTDAVAAGEAAVAGKWTSDKQADVDALTTAIKAAIAQLVDLADFSELNAAINAAETVVRADYTDATLAILDAAVTAAKAINQNEESVQATVDNAKDEILTAIDGLVGFTDITFTATAVADDVSANYGKANKIVVVFGEPLKDGSEAVLADKTNVDATVSKVNNSVYVFELAANQNLTNGMTLEITPDQGIFTTAGKAINDCSAQVVGNLEEAADLVTADEMTATIANVNDKPYMVDGDKIVLVFNAPVYGNPDTITVNGMEFSVVANTDNTVYEKVLDADVDVVAAGQELAYGDIKATLKGTFGATVVPVVVRALVEDVDGTALTAGDKINVFFSAPTNKEADAVETNFAGVLAGATGKWLNNQTLVITLGNTAITVNDKIDLSGLAIKDFYGTKAVDATDIALEGSFGTAIQPKLLTVTAISKQGKGAPMPGDEIHLAFNVKMREDYDLNLQGDFAFNYGDYGTGASVAWATGEEYVDYSTIIITLGKDANVIPGTTKITIKKELFEETGIKKCEVSDLENRIVTGTFGTSIAPELLSATIVKTKPVVGPQNGDQIVLLFNVPTNGKNIDNLIKVNNAKSLGTGYVGTWNTDNTMYTIELGTKPTVAGGDTIVFENDGNLKDINDQKQAKSTPVEIQGSFGEEAEQVGISPSMVTATIVKTTTTVGPQKGDKIVFAFNVPTNGAKDKNDDNDIDKMKDFFNAHGKLFGDGLNGYWNNSNTIYTLVLGDEATVNDDKTITFTPQAGIQDKDCINPAVTLSCELVGSFGEEPVTAAPVLLKAVIIKESNTSGPSKGDKIQLIFNVAINNANLYEALNGEHVFGEGSFGEKNSNVYTITLGERAVNVPTTIDIPKSAGLKDEAEYSEVAEITGVKVVGSFEYKEEIKVLSAIAYSKDGSGIAKKDDTILVSFNNAVKDVTISSDDKPAIGNIAQISENDNYNYIVTLGENPTIKVGDKLTIKATSVYSGKVETREVTLGGSFGTIVEPELISATAYSKDGSGVAKKDDKIVLVFNTPVEGVTSALGTVNNVDSKTIYEIILTDTNVQIGSGLKFNVTAIANSITKEVKANLGGSFGTIVEPEILGATYISKDGSGVAKVGDKIVIVFNTPVTGVTSTLGTVKVVNNGTVFEITLTDTKVKIGDELVFNVTAIDNSTTKEVKTNLKGSFGYSEAPEVKSVTLSEEDGKEVITVVFDQPTTGNGINTSTLYLNNHHLGQSVSQAAFVGDSNNTVLKITLPADATTKDTDKLNLSGLGITAALTGKPIEGINDLEIKGSIVPVVKEVKFVEKSIQITFSARTNGVANISNLVTLLGAGSTATWSENNKVLTIALGENYTITNNGFIVLNGMGIRDGFSGKHNVVGQYKVEGSIATEKLAVEKIVAQSTDKSVTAAQKGDTIVVKFNSATDLNGATLNTLLSSADVDKIISIEGGNEAALGTNYTAMWTAYDTLVITLGGTYTEKVDDAEVVKGIAPAIAVGTEITVKNVKFANGEGQMDETSFKLSGSFNGREFVLTDAAITRTAGNDGDYRVTVKAEDTLIAPNIIPTIVCVAFNGTNPISVMRISVDVENTVQPVFEFAEAYEITSAKIYVFNELFGDINSSPSVLAETIEVK